MVFLLSLLSFTAIAAGVFGLGVGLPIRETWFGASLLISASVAITGGFALAGLATVVFELRRVVHGFKAPPSEMPRPVRPLERSDERIDGPDRGAESRLRMPVVLGAADAIRKRYGAAETGERWHKSRSEAWLRHLQDEIESGPRPANSVPPPIEDHHTGDIPRPSNSWPRPAIPMRRRAGPRPSRQRIYSRRSGPPSSATSQRGRNREPMHRPRAGSTPLIPNRRRWRPVNRPPARRRGQRQSSRGLCRS